MAQRAEVVDVVDARLVRLRLLLCGQEDEGLVVLVAGLPGHRLVQGGDGAFPPDEEGHYLVGEDDNVPQGHEGKRRRAPVGVLLVVTAEEHECRGTEVYTTPP